MIRTIIKDRCLQVMVGQAFPKVCVAKIAVPKHQNYTAFKEHLEERLRAAFPEFCALLHTWSIMDSLLREAFILSRNGLVSRSDLKVFLEHNPGVRVCPYNFPDAEILKIEDRAAGVDERVWIRDENGISLYSGQMFIDCRFKESDSTHDLNDFAEFDFYQAQAGKTAIYPTDGLNGLVYTALGLNGEAGEVAEHVKKAVRDDQGVLTEDRRNKLSKEIGDVLWYVGRVAAEAGIPFSQIAAENLNKLARRQEEGKIQGSGSDR